MSNNNFQSFDQFYGQGMDQSMLQRNPVYANQDDNYKKNIQQSPGLIRKVSRSPMQKNQDSFQINELQNKFEMQKKQLESLKDENNKLQNSIISSKMDQSLFNQQIKQQTFLPNIDDQQYVNDTSNFLETSVIKEKNFRQSRRNEQPFEPDNILVDYENLVNQNKRQLNQIQSQKYEIAKLQAILREQESDIYSKDKMISSLEKKVNEFDVNIQNISNLQDMITSQQNYQQDVQKMSEQIKLLNLEKELSVTNTSLMEKLQNELEDLKKHNALLIQNQFNDKKKLETMDLKQTCDYLASLMEKLEIEIPQEIQNALGKPDKIHKEIIQLMQKRVYIGIKEIMLINRENIEQLNQKEENIQQLQENIQQLQKNIEMQQEENDSLQQLMEVQKEQIAQIQRNDEKKLNQEKYNKDLLGQYQNSMDDSTITKSRPKLKISSLTPTNNYGPSIKVNNNESPEKKGFQMVNNFHPNQNSYKISTIQGKLRIQIVGAQNLQNVAKSQNLRKTQVFLQLRFGTQKFKTRNVSGYNPIWNEFFDLDITLNDQNDIPKLKLQLFNSQPSQTYEITGQNLELDVSDYIQNSESEIEIHKKIYNFGSNLYETSDHGILIMRFTFFKGLNAFQNQLDDIVRD